MPSHQDRIRSKNPEMNCKHSLFLIIERSNIAPFIEPNGDRTTIIVCINCGFTEKYTRTQEQFERELDIL